MLTEYNCISGIRKKQSTVVCLLGAEYTDQE